MFALIFLSLKVNAYGELNSSSVIYASSLDETFAGTTLNLVIYHVI